MCVGTHWGICDQVQVLRVYGNIWQERNLACRPTGTARGKGSEKSSGSDWYFFLLITELVIRHGKPIISPTSVGIFRFELL